MQDVKVACDCGGTDCQCVVTMQCACRRCFRESDDEKFHSSDEHKSAVEERHERVRGRSAEWYVI